MEVTATGLELLSTVTGNRTFSTGTFAVTAGANAIGLTSTSTITLDASADDALLANQPTGGTALAIATTKYVDDAVSASTDVYNELPSRDRWCCSSQCFK